MFCTKWVYYSNIQRYVQLYIVTKLYNVGYI